MGGLGAWDQSANGRCRPKWVDLPGLKALVSASIAVPAAMPLVIANALPIAAACCRIPCG